MGLNQEQKSAVEYLDGPLLVLAGPGTGKTQLLSAKVAYILEHTDTNPENILCITFTESGARNMRERLRSMIGHAASNVNIFTYHAFGTDLLEKYQQYNDHPEREIDSAISEVAKYKIFQQIQADLPANHILKTTKIKDLAETISHAKSARLTSDDLAQIAKRNLSDSAKISTDASDILHDLVPRMPYDSAITDVYQPLLETLIEYSDIKPIVKTIEPIANQLVRELTQIINEQYDLEKPSISPFTKWKNKRFELDAEGNYRLKDYIANRKLAELANIMSEYEKTLRAKGWYDFDDMIEEAIRALQDDRGFRLSMSERFQYILLDEFQDTNPSQFELIKLLTDYERPVVMAVGDDDQAIFEFQGANASNLIDFQEHYQAKVITLVNNYRSTGEILDFSHRVAEQMNDSFAKHHHINKSLRSMRDQLEFRESMPCQIERHEFSISSDECYWVATHIRKLLDAGVNPDEIAIIAPQHKYIAPLLPYLKNQQIDIAYEKKSNLLEDPRIHELTVLAEFISDLANEQQPNHRLLEILSFPWLGITPTDALKVVFTARQSDQSTIDFLQNSNDERLQHLGVWLANLVRTSFTAPLTLWLDYLIGNCELEGQRSPYLAYYEEHNTALERFELYENLTVLKDTVINYTKNPQPRLADFITMLQDYTDADASIINTNPYRDAEHAVQVMSAHKSKGLEFKWVFMIAVDELAWGKAKGNNNMFSLPANLTQIRHTGTTEDEKLRLLFVAITRAKSHLVMTNSIHDFNGKTPARLEFLGELRDEKSEQQLSPLVNSQGLPILTHYDEFDENQRLEELRNDWVSHYQVLTPNLKLMLREGMANYRLTATDLTDFIDLVYAGPQAVYRHRVLKAPTEPITAQLAYGNLMHNILEQITNQGINDVQAFELLRQKSLEIPLPSHDITTLQEKSTHSLSIILREFGHILRAKNARGEVNLSPEHLAFDGVPLTGKIDHIHLDPNQKTIEIYDFKTGNYHDTKWQNHPTLYKYSLQLEFYKLLLELSPSYRNYRVTRGHILFISPDLEDHVYDKPYEYEIDGAETIRHLARVIYHLLTELDFVEDAELNLPSDKSKTAKHLREFVQKLVSLDK